MCKGPGAGTMWVCLGDKKGHCDRKKVNKGGHCMGGGWRDGQGPDLVRSCRQ